MAGKPKIQGRQDPSPTYDGHFVPKTLKMLQAFVCQTVLPEDRLGKPPPKDSLIQSVQEHAEQILEVSKKHWSYSFYTTKLATWREALGHAGLLDPNDSSQEHNVSLFARHTALVSTSRIIIEILRGNTSITQAQVLKDCLDQGFSAWTVEHPEPLEILVSMAEEIASYDWKGTSHDILKEIYHELIESSDRREFGEYYTPDWLAREVVQQVLDETWLDQAILTAAEPESSDEGISILDPSCGSGTFLRITAEHILDRIRTNHPNLWPQGTRNLPSDDLRHGYPSRCRGNGPSYLGNRSARPAV